VSTPTQYGDGGVQPPVQVEQRLAGYPGHRVVRVQITRVALNPRPRPQDTVPAHNAMQHTAVLLEWNGTETVQTLGNKIMCKHAYMYVAEMSA